MPLFENNFHFFAFFHFCSGFLKKYFIYNLFINKHNRPAARAARIKNLIVFLL